MKLIEVKSDINNKIDLLIEHKILNNNSHHLNYVLTKINEKFYFVDAKSELVTIKNDLICPYCLQKLTINRTYKKKNGTIVQFFVKHKSKNKMSEDCIFKQKAVGGYNQNVDLFYKSKEFVHRSVILMLKNEIGNGFEISIPDEYKIIIEDDVSIKFKYKKHRIIGIYPSNRDEFICRLKTDKNKTLFCMLGENEINIRNNYKDIWSKYDVTVVTFNENKPYLNSEIESKLNIHSKFYTTCLYSKVQQDAYEDYIIEHEKYKNNKKIFSNDIAKDVMGGIPEKNIFNIERDNKTSILERAVDHELNRVKVLLEYKVGLKQIDENLWTTSDGKYYKLRKIKITKNDIYFYRECPEIYIKYIETFGYRIEIT